MDRPKINSPPEADAHSCFELNFTAFVKFRKNGTGNNRVSCLPAGGSPHLIHFIVRTDIYKYSMRLIFKIKHNPIIKIYSEAAHILQLPRKFVKF